MHPLIKVKKVIKYKKAFSEVRRKIRKLKKVHLKVKRMKRKLKKSLRVKDCRNGRILTEKDNKTINEILIRIAYASSEGSGEHVHQCSLIRAFTYDS